MKPALLCLTLLLAPVCGLLAQSAAPATPKSTKPQGATKALVAPATPATETLQVSVAETQSLVKVNVTYQNYNLQMPWQKESANGRRGLGVVMQGNRILVTGQLVGNATYIELELPDAGQKIPAKVLAVDYEANLALLAPDSPAKEKGFFASLKPMGVDASGKIGDELAVWQTGRVGELIVTPLSISKVLIQPYVIESSTFLVYEAIGIIRSEANSFTLPVIKGNKLAGLLLRYDSKNQVATLLPAPIIEHFLKDFADGQYDGFPSLGVEFQMTMDDQFREYLGMKPDQAGVYVSKVLKGASADKAGVLKGDIMKSINGHRIDSRGDYRHPHFGALSVSHVVRGEAYVNDQVEIKVLRDGKETTLKSRLTRKGPEDYLVRPYLFDRGPKYILNGGLLFQELNRPYLNSFGAEQQNGPLLRLLRLATNPDDFEAQGRKKVVFLSAVLPTTSTQGYERLSGQIIDEVNGKKISELADVAAAFKEPQDGLHVVKLQQFPYVVYLDAVSVERDNLRLTNGMFRVSALSRLD